MNFGWASEEERILRYIRIPAKKKLEWLQKMHDFLVTTATPERKKIFWKLRNINIQTTRNLNKA